MPVITTSTNYTGRTVDLYVAGALDISRSGPQQVTYSFGLPPAGAGADAKKVTKYVAGVQKLAQRYIVKLINSGFVEELLGCSSSNVSVARSVFFTKNWSVIREFRKYQSENPDTPQDEMISVVDLNSISVDPSSPDTVTFSITLVTVQGTSITALLPLPL